MFCAPGRTRTYDRQIRRLLLYPLSYGGRELLDRKAASRITVAPERSSSSLVYSERHTLRASDQGCLALAGPT